ncbi:MAG TPA: DNA methyltransferase [Thermoplasmata archaeon]|nr:DNA methyltransferase [Thermoplasmata archaeon]
MIRVLVEPSGEAPGLARLEATSAAAAVGGRERPTEIAGVIGVDLPDRPSIERLAARLALARRCLVEVDGGASFGEAVATEGNAGESAVFRRLGRSPGGADDGVREAGRRYVGGGGTIDLERPARRYWIAEATSGDSHLLREVAAVDRAQSSARRMPLLPFQRPVSLPPRLARAAANLTGLRPGDRVVDPFLGTGALLAEAALLGATVYGIDRDPEMVRGALRNFAHLGVEAARITEGDSGTVDLDGPDLRFDALLTDPPYGRSSYAGGERPAEVVARVLPRWAERVRDGGRVVVVSPEGSPVLPDPWAVRNAVSVRVHRSLTREFRVYERAG